MQIKVGVLSMNIFVWISLLSGIYFLLQGLFIKDKPTFLRPLSFYFNVNHYSESEIARSQKLSSVVSFVVAYLIFKNILQNAFILLIVIVWGISNQLFLKKVVSN